MTQFLGPGNRTCSSLTEMADSYFRNYWPGWNVDQSYIIPPIFEYKHSNVSDQSIEIAQKAGIVQKGQALMKDRATNEAERIAYGAIHQLVHENFKGPIVAVQNLNLSTLRAHLPSICPRLNFCDLHDRLKTKLEKQLSSTFQQQPELEQEWKDDGFEKKLWENWPELDWQKLKLSNGKFAFLDLKELKPILDRYFCEYDFVLFGPNIGMIVIEAKSSEYTQSRHFAAGDARLPDDYVHGLEELGGADALFRVLEEITKTTLPRKYQKVLFTPNLERKRFEEWMATLTSDDRKKVEDMIQESQVIQWFREDMGNTATPNAGTPPLYESMKSVLNAGTSISQHVFEECAPILAAFACIKIIEKNRQKTVDLDPTTFSLELAFPVECRRVEKQDPLFSKKPSKQSRHSTLIADTPQGYEKLSHAIWLTPDQIAAMQGPNRQFIVGAAGSGKSIVLQMKILQLLQNAGKILVFAADGFVREYKELLNSPLVDPTACTLTVKSWPDEMRKLREKLNTKYLLGNMKTTGEKEVHDHIRTVINRANLERNTLLRGDIFELLANFDHVFIDDAFDELVSNPKKHDWRDSCLVMLAIMEFAEKYYPGHSIWIAVDPFAEYKFTGWKGLYEEGKLLCSHFGKGCCSITELTQIMRCSNSVYRLAYSKLSFRTKIYKNAEMAHKIEGIPSISINGDYLEAIEALDELMKMIGNTLDWFHQKGIGYENIAVLIGTNISATESFSSTVFDRCNQKFASLMGAGLTMKKWNEVGSLEWPIVIFGCCVRKGLARNNKREHVEYIKYRALSRGMVTVVEIICSYKKSVL